MGPLARYTLLRLGLFAACLLVLWPLADGVLLVGLAALLSLLLSYPLLARQRDAAAGVVATRVDRRLAARRPLGADDAAAEDAVVEGTAAEGTAGATEARPQRQERPSSGSSAG